MLVLTRKPGERIKIGDNVSLIVNRIYGNRVAVGIVAPDGMKIIRAELDCGEGLDRKDQNGRTDA